MLALPFRPVRWGLRILLGAVVLAVGAFAVTSFRVWHTGQSDARPRSDVILVEGAAQYNGRPSAVLTARLQHALELWGAGVAPRVMTVGGNRPGDIYTEAGSGREWLIQHGMPASDVVAVGQGSDTLLSLRAAAPVLDAHRWHSVVVVTDPWHELRSRTITRDLGFAAEASPVTDGPSTRGFDTQVRYVGREAAAYLYYTLFHRASRTGPPAT